jgi:cell wall-associated NlpC family hydrolase
MLFKSKIALPLAAVAFDLLGTAEAFPRNFVAEPRASSSPKVGYVNVSATTLWTNSKKPRPVDAPALASPAHIQKWLDDMTNDQFLDLTNSDRTQTQALYGAPVDILEEQDGWYSIAVPGQPTPKESLGYPGWVPANQVATEDIVYGLLQETLPFALVKNGPTVPLYKDPLLKDKMMDITFDTRLPALIEDGKFVQVAVPGGIAYLSAEDTAVYKSESDIPYPTAEDLINTGKIFLGRPYLWGGTSGYAFDCSGFTHTIYHAHGITLPRDAAPQAYWTGHGTPVNQTDLAAGDLIFYASNLTDPESIYHVAMYAGDGQMMEAYGNPIPIRLTPVRFGSDYWGAERFLKN